MYIQLVDKDGFKSPVLYIHSNEDEFMEQINLWQQKVYEILDNYPHVDGLPLGRLDPNTCMVDLIRYLADYYIKSTPLSFVPAGHVYTTLAIKNEENLAAGDVITRINLYEE